MSSDENRSQLPERIPDERAADLLAFIGIDAKPTRPRKDSAHLSESIRAIIATSPEQREAQINLERTAREACQLNFNRLNEILCSVPENTLTDVYRCLGPLYAGMILLSQGLENSFCARDELLKKAQQDSALTTIYYNDQLEKERAQREQLESKLQTYLRSIAESENVTVGEMAIKYKDIWGCTLRTARQRFVRACNADKIPAIKDSKGAFLMRRLDALSWADRQPQKAERRKATSDFDID